MIYMYRYLMSLYYYSYIKLIIIRVSYKKKENIKPKLYTYEYLKNIILYIIIFYLKYIQELWISIFLYNWCKFPLFTNTLAHEPQ